MELSQFKTVEQLAAAIKTMDMVTAVPWTPYHDTSTIVGWTSYTTKEIYYTKIFGKLVFVNFSLRGTSDDTTISFTLPFAKEGDSSALIFKPGRARDNSGWLNGTAIGQISGADAAFFTDEGFATWTASNEKAVYGQFFYVAA